MIRDMIGSKLDPSVIEGCRTTKVGFDCTRPAAPHSFAKKLAVPKEIVERVKAAGYLNEDQIKASRRRP
jgi:3-polyprenyl-4-hydroxybenzoate decarboxylase